MIQLHYHSSLPLCRCQQSRFLSTSIRFLCCLMCVSIGLARSSISPFRCFNYKPIYQSTAGMGLFTCPCSTPLQRQEQLLTGMSTRLRTRLRTHTHTHTHMHTHTHTDKHICFRSNFPHTLKDIVVIDQLKRFALKPKYEYGSFCSTGEYNILPTSEQNLCVFIGMVILFNIIYIITGTFD